MATQLNTSKNTAVADVASMDPAFETKAANTIRFLSADAVQQAKSGHPGLPMGMATAAMTLWTRFLRHNPQNPKWANRDRFILSAGHGSMLLYSLLYLTGYDFPLDDIKRFRQLHSAAAGHPEYGYAKGIETTTGPLGQGFATGVGMAMAEKWYAARYNRDGLNLINHYIYAIVSDGDLMEGIAAEAASLAGHLKLGNMIYLYDDNDVTLDTMANASYTEDWAERFEAYGWHVQKIDGMSSSAVAEAIVAAQKDPRPSIIGCKTIIGYGAPNKQGTSKAHGEPLGDDELNAAKDNLGWPKEPRFYVPEDVLAFFRQAVPKGAAQEEEWNALLKKYGRKCKAEAAEFQQLQSGVLPKNWEAALPAFGAGTKSDGTRNYSGPTINALAKVLPNLIGGSADLAGSTKTTISGYDFIQANNFATPNMRFGVREHAMAAALNGMALYGGLIPFGGTFLVFSDYMRGSIRLAALMGLRVIYVLTHDSIGVGEDGPTHQPIEQVAALRAVPNLTVIRPADAPETAEAWRAAIKNTGGPTALIFSRQNVPVYDRSKPGMGAAGGAAKGGYIFYENAPNGVQIILIGTGTEVQLAYDAAQKLVAEGIGVRVVSLPSWELFQKQSETYQRRILPGRVRKLAVEAGTTFGWERWVGNDKARGDVIGIDQFGASAPYQQVYQELGLTVDAVVARAKTLIG
ncbi:MAG: transketolase [Caldilineaceae bacterium]